MAAAGSWSIIAERIKIYKDAQRNKDVAVDQSSCEVPLQATSICRSNHDELVINGRLSLNLTVNFHATRPVGKDSDPDCSASNNHHQQKHFTSTGASEGSPRHQVHTLTERHNNISLSLQSSEQRDGQSKINTQSHGGVQLMIMPEGICLSEPDFGHLSNHKPQSSIASTETDGQQTGAINQHAVANTKCKGNNVYTHSDTSLSIEGSAQLNHNFLLDDDHKKNAQFHGDSQLMITPEGLSTTENSSQQHTRVLSGIDMKAETNFPKEKAAKDNLQATYPNLPSAFPDGNLLALVGENFSQNGGHKKENTVHYKGSPLMIIPEELSPIKDQSHKHSAVLPAVEVKGKVDATSTVAGNILKDDLPDAIPFLQLPAPGSDGKLLVIDGHNCVQHSGHKRAIAQHPQGPLTITTEGLSLSKHQIQHNSAVLTDTKLKDSASAANFHTGKLIKDGPKEAGQLLKSTVTNGSLPEFNATSSEISQDAVKDGRGTLGSTASVLLQPSALIDSPFSSQHQTFTNSSALRKPHISGPQLIKTLPEETNQLPPVGLQYNVLYDTNSKDVVPIARDEKPGGGIVKQRVEKAHSTHHKELLRHIQNESGAAGNKGPKPGAQKPTYPKRCCIVAGNKTFTLDPNLLAHPHMDTYFVKERTETRPGHFLARLVLHHVYLDK